MPILRTINKGRVPVKIYTEDIDPSAYNQLSKIAELPFIHSHVAAMPDVHHGIGATVGSVIPTRVPQLRLRSASPLHASGAK